ncbi:hypothetical protein VZT92_007682 [Zoarces viviparus]|uniref:Uncharacterized protein n=1 Tax=Zoarces viviparus TaxID=48416 RepID=A0AAW1FM57_ZOAVI
MAALTCGREKQTALGWVKKQAVQGREKNGCLRVTKWLDGEREELLLLRVEWRETASEMEAGGKDHLCGDWSPGPTDQSWLSFNPPLLPPQRRRETGTPTKQPLGSSCRLLGR